MIKLLCQKINPCSNFLKATRYIIQVYIQATKLYTEPAPALAPVPAKDQDIQMMVSCGPYTTQESDSHQPLLDMLTCVQEAQPHVAVFIGPFVDSKNSALDNLAEPYQQYYENMVKQIYAALETTRTQVNIIIKA